MKRIALSGIQGKGQFTLIDDKDSEFLNQWKWNLSIKGYAMRTERIGERKLNKKRAVFLHRLINQTPVGMETDHINRNKLDNRRENLRSVTGSQNKMNTGLQKNNTSGFKGINWDSKRNQWRVRIHLQGKEIQLGRTVNLLDAIALRNLGETKYFGGIKI